MNRKLRIMVVDDEPIVGKRLKRLFEKADYFVKIFTESSSAIDELREHTFDIVITDLRMEGTDGIGILEIAKEINPDTRVIIITGCIKRKRVDEATQKGAMAFITKPFKINEIKQAVLEAKEEIMKK